MVDGEGDYFFTSPATWVSVAELGMEIIFSIYGMQTMQIKV